MYSCLPHLPQLALSFDATSEPQEQSLDMFAMSKSSKSKNVFSEGFDREMAVVQKKILKNSKTENVFTSPLLLS